ncbi:MAG: hypothetical protein KJ767_02195 [Nanoarchaeota archaeon]|nr:hypothetical protein [Nanoarchaeota archaeon]
MEKIENLKKLKEDYEVLRKKYELPKFEKFNTEFNLESIQTLDTEFLARRLRLLIDIRVGNILSWLEGFMNPQRATVLMFEIINNLKEEEKQVLKEIYSELGELKIDAWKIELLPYNEENEIRLVKDSIKKFDKIKIRLQKIIEKMDRK